MRAIPIQWQANKEYTQRAIHCHPHDFVSATFLKIPIIVPFY